MGKSRETGDQRSQAAAAAAAVEIAASAVSSSSAAAAAAPSAVANLQFIISVKLLLASSKYCVKLCCCHPCSTVHVTVSCHCIHISTAVCRAHMSHIQFLVPLYPAAYGAWNDSAVLFQC